MARSVETIKQEIIDAKNAEAELSALNSPSAVAIFNLWAYIVALSINVFEQIIDLATAEMEQLARDAVPGTSDWLQKRVLEFQYSLTNPQVVTIVDGRASYATVDPDLYIITRAAIKEQANGRVQIKVAKGSGTLEPLNTNELNALKGYVDKIGFAGIPIDSVSLLADRLRFEGEIFYLGEYVESEVKQAVIDAINAYLASLSVENFAGLVVRENLIDAIQAVPGVTGIDTLNVLLNGRPEQDPLGGADNVAIQRTYETAAGYIIEEGTAGNTFNDTIIMTRS